MFSNSYVYILFTLPSKDGSDAFDCDVTAPLESRALTAFQQSPIPADDVTLVVVKFTG